MQINKTQTSFGMATPKVHPRGMTQKHFEILRNEWKDIVEIGKTVALDIREGSDVVRDNYQNKPPVFMITASKDNKTFIERVLHFFHLMPESVSYTDAIDPQSLRVVRFPLKETAQRAKTNFIKGEV